MLSNRTWEHVIKFHKTIKNRVEFAKKMMKEMIKKKLRNVEIDHIMSFIEGTLRYFEDEEKEYQTNQYYVGIQNLF